MYISIYEPIIAFMYTYTYYTYKCEILDTILYLPELLFL